MVWRVGGLDTDEPHLSATRFAKGEAHRPRLPNYLIGSHATRPRLLLFIFSAAQANAHLKNTYNKKSHGGAKSFETIFGFPHYFSSRWTSFPREI